MVLSSTPTSYTPSRPPAHAIDRACGSLCACVLFNPNGTSTCSTMKKGFVYPAGGASYRGVVLPKKEAEKAQLQFERISSPRKRKRSPESLPGPSGLNRFPGTHNNIMYF